MSDSRAGSRLTLWPLVGATYFMVAGGPYGLEDLIASAGYDLALVALLVTPLVWSLPVALMVGELGSAVPEEGGYYAWVRRALGPFWGFLEAWLSLVASIFDMALYPTLFTLYLGQLVPALQREPVPELLGVTMIAGCALWNIRGAGAIGRGALVLTFTLLMPFVVLSWCAFFGATPAAISVIAPATPAHGGTHTGLLTALLVAMWNYMGWDNASTIAGEVDRPQQTYPLAMITAVTLVALTYLVPVLAMRATGLDPSGWSTGSWVVAAEAVGGRWLGRAVVMGGVFCGIGVFSSLVLSYSRLPMVLAEDGYLPALFLRRHPRTGAPWVAIAVCSVAYMAALRLGFARLVEIDVLLYGTSLVLEFVALVALRLREPELARPFRVPGGLPGAIGIGLGPLALLLIALWVGRQEQMAGMNALAFGALLIGAGPILYALRQATACRNHD